MMRFPKIINTEINNGTKKKELIKKNKKLVKF